MRYPKPIEDLIDFFSKYPGVGRKSAERMAIYTITNLKDEEINLAKETLSTIKEKITNCTICGHITDVNPCNICTDETRTDDSIIVVGESKDVFSMEKGIRFDGKYHVIGGYLSPMDGIGVADLNIKSLIERLKDENIKEVILATNATIEGETTAMYIAKLLENTDLLITRIAHGIPVGSDLGYADELTLKKAIDGRNKL